MLLTSILTIITFRTLPGLNKILNEIILTNYGTKKIETKMNYVIYTRITAVILLLTALVSGQVLGFPEIEEGFSIYNGLFQVTQVSLFIEIFIVIIGALILVAWPGLPVSGTTVPGLSVGQVGNVDNTHAERYLNTGINLVNYLHPYSLIIFAMSKPTNLSK